MDTAILSDRLAATEAAVLELDERVDAEVGNDAEATSEAILEARLATLEDKLNQCLIQLQSTQSDLQTTSSEVEVAKVEAEAEVEIAQIEAQAAVAISETLSEPEPEPEMAVEEITPEPEESGAAAPANKPRSTWWEQVLVLR